MHLALLHVIADIATLLQSISEISWDRQGVALANNISTPHNAVQGEWALTINFTPICHAIAHAIPTYACSWKGHHPCPGFDHASCWAINHSVKQP